uniref:Putative secreted protein n=1 Tax=Anopheles darlingi TaxID=43151 RepID=A0A2M4D2C8_ANODA
MWSLLTFVMCSVSPSTTFTLSPPIAISSPSSRRHMTYGSGKPFALQLSVTFVPSRTTISLLVNDSTIAGGTTTCRYPLRDRIGSVLT